MGRQVTYRDFLGATRLFIIIILAGNDKTGRGWNFFWSQNGNAAELHAGTQGVCQCVSDLLHTRISSH
jgi:hypothetical protein